VTYAQTGQSAKINPLGMREMQEKAYQARDAQYLLLKAPPASGKSRALMFIALDKLYKQGLKKVIVAVPERSIGASFAATALTQDGFFKDWQPSDVYNLCTGGGEGSKVKAFKDFMVSAERILICTHSTLRFAYDELDDAAFNDVVLAIDEFHHVNASEDSRLGALLRGVVGKSSAHVVAMTGSYFRGDALPVLSPEDEEKFTKVTYNYYEQLNGYTHLKSLGIGYHFYTGKYISAIAEVLDTDKKTILHIPNVNAGEAYAEKSVEVNRIIDTIGEMVRQDSLTGVMTVKRKTDGKLIKVADLVYDEPAAREKISSYLRTMKSRDDMDLIIALGMAKEGFDWPYCEHALTVGYRGSLTEIIQIIGRCTRDSPNKVHAQFTNLIASPDAEQGTVKVAVNNMLKAITASLLMEQVLAPNWKFKTKLDDNDKAGPGEIKVKGLKTPTSKRVKEIIEDDLNDLKATILQDADMLKAMPGNVAPEVMNKVLIPKIILAKYPGLTAEEVDQIRQYVVVDAAIKTAEIKDSGDKRFVRLADKFINIDELHIDLIDRINPFQKAFEVLSKSVTTRVLRLIQESIASINIVVGEDEALLVWPDIKAFRASTGREPSLQSNDSIEKRMAEVIIYLKDQKRKLAGMKAAAQNAAASVEGEA
jgi:superfamily II DNA or RNA helicase